MPESRRYSYYVLGVLLLGYVFNYLDRYVLSILLPAIKADLGLSDAMLGFLLGPAFGFVYAFAGIPVARLADTRSRTGVIAIGMTLWSLFTAASGLVQNSFQLLCARMTVGVGEAAGPRPPTPSSPNISSRNGAGARWRSSAPASTSECSSGSSRGECSSRRSAGAGPSSRSASRAWRSRCCFA